MAQIIPDRVCAQIEGDFVVFLIGIRINKWWKFTAWLPAFAAMPRMLRELSAKPVEETGFLGYTTLGFGIIQQHWRSFDHLEAYANARDHTHFPAMVAFNKRAKGARGDVGIWHETYLVRAGEYESLYSGTPARGLGKVGKLVPATGNRAAARARLSSGKA